MFDESLLSVDEEARRRFELACSTGDPVPLGEFLPHSGHPLYLGTLEELVHIHLERGWRHRNDQRTGPTLEPLLERYPELNSPKILGRLVQQEFRARLRWGDGPATSEYHQRFPALFTVDTPLDLGQNDVMQIQAGKATNELPVLDGYDMLSLLGRGGMGVVYKARHRGLNRVVAIKMISTVGAASEDQLRRFRTEAESVAQLQHPNIVQIYEVGEFDGRPFFSLEFVAGGSLNQICSGNPQLPSAAASLVETLARAVHIAHQRGIVHRDLKPANVLLALPHETTEPNHSEPIQSDWLTIATPKIADFGLAKRLQEDSGQTRTGDILGTPSYMAPEQAAGQASQIGPTTDVYALGAILYELLTGRAPFRAATALDTVRQVIHDDPVTPCRLNPRVPTDLDTICMKCLEKAPSRRYASAQDLAEDLLRFREKRPIHAKPTSLVSRAIKWSQRKPAWAALIAVSLVASVAILWGGIAFTLRLGEEVKNTKIQRDAKQQALADLQTAHLNLQSESDLKREADAIALRQAKTALYTKTIARAHEHLRRFELKQAESALQQCPAEDQGWEWHYLEQTRQRSATDLGEAHILAYDAKGDRLALARKNHRDGYFAVEIRQLTKPTATLTMLVTCVEINSIALSPGGDWVAFDMSGVWNQASKQFDANQLALYSTDGKERRTWLAHKAEITSIEFHPKGNEIATGSKDGTLKLWNLEGELLATLDDKKGPIQSLTIDIAGTRLACGGADGSVRIWNWQDRKMIHHLVDNHSPLRCVRFHPDGRRLACASADGVRIWNLEQEKIVQVIGPRREVVSLAFDDVSRLLGSVEPRGSVAIWNVEDGRQVHTLPEEKAQQLAFRPGKQHLAYAGHLARVLDLSPKREVLSLPIQADLRALAVSPDGKCLLVGGVKGKDGVIFALDSQTGQVTSTWQSKDDALGRVAFDASGQRFASAGFFAKVWHINTLNGMKEKQAWLPHQGKRVHGIAFAGDFLVTCGADQRIAIWTDSGEHRFTSANFKKSVNDVCLSPSGNQFASAGFDQLVRIWNIPENHEVVNLKLSALATSLAFQPKGNLLACGASDGSIVLYDTANNKTIRSWRAHENGIDSLAFSPTGTCLATMGWNDATLRLWDAQTGQELLSLTSPSARPTRIAFSPDGRRLFVVGNQPSVIGIFDTTPHPQPTGAETIKLDHRQKNLRGFLDVALAARNATAINVTLHLRYFQSDAWSPAEDRYLAIPLAANETKRLLADNQPIIAKRVKYWVENAKGDVLMDHRDKAVELLPTGADIYLAPERQTHMLVVGNKE